jgi:hypothetical protein
MEGYELDLDKGISSLITYSIDDITKLDTKKSSYSKTIVLPGTTNNNKLFGYIFEFGNANFSNNTPPNVQYNFNASKSAVARIDVNGLTVIKGVLRLLEIIIKDDIIEYEVAIFGEFAGFFSKVGAKKIEDIDLSILNHTYNYNNIVNSWETNSNIVVQGTFTASSKMLSIVNAQEIYGYEITISGTTSNNGLKKIVSVNNTIVGGLTVCVIIFSDPIVNESSNTINIQWERIGNSYYYPLIDYGNVSPQTNANFQKRNFYYTAFRPAVYVRTLIDKIITGAGYTWSSNFFNTEYFKRLIIPNNQQRLAYKKTTIFSASCASMDTTVNRIVMGNVEPGFFTTTDNKVWTYTGAQTWYGTIPFSVQGRWRISNQQFFGNRSARFVIYKNGAVWASEFVIFGGGVTQIGGFGNSTTYVPFNINFTFSGLFSSLSVQNGDEIYWTVISTGGTDTIEIQITGGSTSLVGAPTYAPAVLGDKITLTDTLPKGVLQKDFFTSIMKMFYLMITEDKLKDKHLVIEPFQDFYNTNPTTYIDWSDKVDRSRNIKIKPMSEITYRYYEMKWKDDTDYWNDKYKKKWNAGYGSRIYDNQQEFAKDSDKVEVIFSPTPLIGYNGNVPSTAYDKVFPAIYKFNNNAEESTEFNIRIMFANKANCTSWTIYNSTTVPNTNAPIPLGASLTNYGYAGHLYVPSGAGTYDMNFGAPNELFYSLFPASFVSYTSFNLFNLWYSSYFAEVTDKDSRLVTLYIKLSEIDIYNLDFSKFILIDGVLYRIDTIKDYSFNEIVEVSLLRVISTTYY